MKGSSQMNESKYFAPISSSISNFGNDDDIMSKSNKSNTSNVNLIDFFNRGMNLTTNNKNNFEENESMSSSNLNKIQSVEELEAKILQSGQISQPRIITKGQNQRNKQDVVAFKKLLSQMSDKSDGSILSAQQQQPQISGNSNPINNQIRDEGNELLHILNKQCEQDDVKKMFPLFLNFNNSNNNFGVSGQQQNSGIIPPTVPQIRPQNECPSNLNNNSSDVFKNIFPGIQQNQIDSKLSDIIKRPEAQSIIEGKVLLIFLYKIYI